MKSLIKLVALAALIVPSLASAQQVLTLKGAPQNADGRVTVGDVFDNAGPIAGVLLGYRSANTVILDAATVQSTVGANGGYWANPRGQHRIVVTAQGAGQRPVAQPQAQAAPPAQLVAQPENPFTSHPAAPAASAPAPMPVLAAVATPQVSAANARGPIVVHRQEALDVTWRAAGISLTMTGVAMKDAAIGDTVSIQNPASKKTIDAVITGPGHAIAGPAADSYRASVLQLSSR